MPKSAFDPIPSEGVGKAIAVGVSRVVSPLVDGPNPAHHLCNPLPPMKPKPRGPPTPQAQGDSSGIKTNTKGPPKNVKK